MSQQEIIRSVSRRCFGRGMAAIAGAGVLGTSAIGLTTPGSVIAEEPRHKGHFPVESLPFSLQQHFDQCISCNCTIVKPAEIEVAGKKVRAIQQRPGNFGWATGTYFLDFDPKLMGKDITFFSTVGWNGKPTGEVIFSVEINGDIVISDAISEKDTWTEIQRTLPLRNHDMRLTLMLDSIKGNNDFSFWWGDPQLRA
jgi:hypothetical protein